MDVKLFFKSLVNAVKKTGMTMVDGVISVVIGVILIAQVAIPVVTDAVANITGTAGTILGQLDIFLAIAGLVLVASLMRSQSINP